MAAGGAPIRLPPRVYCDSSEVRRRCHSRVLVTVSDNGRFPPVIPVTPFLEEVIPKVILEQYFCKYPLSTSVSEYSATRQRVCRYHLHCHCCNPNSLQCRTIFKITRCIVLQFKIYTSRKVACMANICCGTLTCSPIFSMGIVRNYEGSYVFSVGVGNGEGELLQEVCQQHEGELASNFYSNRLDCNLLDVRGNRHIEIFEICVSSDLNTAANLVSRIIDLCRLQSCCSFHDRM